MTRAAPDPGDAGRPLVGITMGDPGGIGAEVIVKALADPELRRAARFIVYGLEEIIAVAADDAEIAPFWWRVPREHGPRVASGVALADFDDLNLPPLPRQRAPDPLCGYASMQFLESAVAHLRDGAIDALVTAPISKTSWSMANYGVTGHTELLAQRFETRRVTMMFDGGPLRVALASVHLPLFELRHHFTIGLVRQPIDLLHAALRDYYDVADPHVGVLGLNPHAGEGGLLGDEEGRIIEPALTHARQAGIRVSGPLSPDTAFLPHVASRFDGLVAMYHDQGLIPLKLAALHQAVNVTLGLPVIRTSPAHGTAFDIAGQNRAHPGSMASAIRLAIRFASVAAARHGAAAPRRDRDA